ncbi:MAG: zinc ribbon domain-containing protein [Gemmatimonadota bacterium]
MYQSITMTPSGVKFLKAAELMNLSWGKIFSVRFSRSSTPAGSLRPGDWRQRTSWSGSRAAAAVERRCSSSGNAAKRHYRYYACANRAQDRSCPQPYIPAGRLEGAVIGKLQDLADHPAGIRPFLNREIRHRRAGRRDLARPAVALDHEIGDLDSRQREMVEWLAETQPGKAAARKLNEKIEAVEQQKKALAEERATLRGSLAAGDLAGVTAESIAAAASVRSSR